MATPSELARLRTELDHDQTEHLQRLLGSWSLLADLSFSDLLLVAPVSSPPPGTGPQLVVLGQVRPNNRSTLISQDLVGQTVFEQRWDLAAEALHTGRLVKGSMFDTELDEAVPVWNVPVRHRNVVIGVLVRIQGPLRGTASMYERTYLDVFERFCTMISESTFPFQDEEVAAEETPRVGDGAIVVDGDGRVELATPNAINALHRLGIFSPPDGSRFDGLGVDAHLVQLALESGRPVVEEIERRPDVAVLAHCVPLLETGQVTGALILLRDVTDLRRLDRLVLSKDQAIREVHHRVKNNLQTISALLRLQARRTDDDRGRQSLLEAERRIRSIAIVHEILSREPGDDVEFSEIAELLQNAVEHAFVGEGAQGAVGHIGMRLRRERGTLFAEVRDNGRGIPEGFSIDATSSLGLSIVRDLIKAQLEGEMEMTTVPADQGGGTLVSLRVPIIDRRSLHPTARPKG